MSPRPHKPRLRRQFRGVRHPSLGAPGAPHPGTDQEWEQVMQSPQVQAALSDPAIQQALYQNFRGTGGSLSGPPTSGGAEAGAAQPPLAMQEGGMANALDINEIMQMLADPNTSEQRKMSLRASLARLAEQRPKFPQPVEEDEAPRTTTLRFQEGGFSTQEEINQLEMDKQGLISKPNKTQADLQNIDRLDTTIRNLRMRSMQPQAAGMNFLGGGNLSAGTMAGLQRLATAGPPTVGNTLGAMGLAGLIGLGSTQTPGPAALVGAGIAGVLNYFIRKSQAKKQGAASGYESTSSGGKGGGGSGYYGGDQKEEPAHPSATAAPAQPQAADTGVAPSPPSAVIPNPGEKATKVEVYKPWLDPKSTYYRKELDPNSPYYQKNLDKIQQAPGSTATGTTDSSSAAASAPGTYTSLWMASGPKAQSGNVYSHNGRDWFDSVTNKPYTDAVFNPQQISPGSSLASAGPGTPTANLPGGGALDVSNLPTSPTFDPLMLAPGYINPSSFGQGAADVAPGTGVSDVANEQAATADSSLYDTALYDEEAGYRRGGKVRRFAEGGLRSALVPPEKSPRAVLMRKPIGMPIPIPILHTTIVIATKAKPEKKEKNKKKAEGGVVRPKRPDLIPPRRGPQDGETVHPRPHGRVQVPRGSGAAIRGKRFGGIF